MDRSSSRVLLMLAAPVVILATCRAEISCPPMPDVGKVSHDVYVDIQGRVDTLGKLGGAQLGAKTDVIAKPIFEGASKDSRETLATMMTAMYCSAIRDSTTMSDTTKLIQLKEMSERVMRFYNPSYAPTLPAPAPKAAAPPGAVQALLTNLQAFIRARPGENAPYEWQQYVDDARRLYLHATEFYSLLKDGRIRYTDASVAYAALDEAADELSMRGRLMHDSGRVSENYDQHIFVGPGWFRLSLQKLRRAHESQTALSEEQLSAFQEHVGVFGADIEYWKLCWSGTEPGGSSCK
jgi:hypothetical protein